MDPVRNSRLLRLAHLGGGVIGALLVLAWWASGTWPMQLRQHLRASTMEPDGGFAWVVRAPLSSPFTVASDDGEQHPSRLELTEDGRQLGPGHQPHDDVRLRGGGGYSHWQGQLWFSTTDGSDPRTNGRCYAVAAPAQLSPAWLAAGATLLIAAMLAWMRRRMAAGHDPATTLRRTLGGAAITTSLLAMAALGWWRLHPCVIEQEIPADASGAIDLFGNPRPWRIPPFFVGVWPDLVHADEVSPTTTRFDLPVVPSPGAFAIVSLLAATGVWLLLRRRRPVARSAIGALAALVALAMAPTAAVLFGLDVAGALTAPLRAPLDDLPFEPSFGALDRTRDWAELRDRLTRGDGESTADFVRRLDTAVADGIAHVWDRRYARELRLQVPASENWLLWLLGELDPRQREYFFVDARRMLERGVGMCGHASHVLGELLADAGLDARLVQLGGHTLVTVDVDGRWWTADPDFGVVLEHSIDELGAEPSLALPAFTAALARFGRDDPAGEAARLVALFDPAGNTISRGRPADALPERPRRVERLAYDLRWPVPVAMLLLWLASELVGRRRAR